MTAEVLNVVFLKFPSLLWLYLFFCIESFQAKQYESLDSLAGLIYNFSNSCVVENRSAFESLHISTISQEQEVRYEVRVLSHAGLKPGCRVGLRPYLISLNLLNNHFII